MIKRTVEVILISISFLQSPNSRSQLSPVCLGLKICHLFSSVTSQIHNHCDSSSLPSLHAELSVMRKWVNLEFSQPETHWSNCSTVARVWTFLSCAPWMWVKLFQEPFDSRKEPTYALMTVNSALMQTVWTALNAGMLEDKGNRENCLYQQVHHVWFVVSERLYGVKDVNAALLSQHLAHDADAAENATATPAVPERGKVMELFTTRWRQNPTEEH